MLLICQSYPPYLPIIPVVITERGGGKSFQSKKPTGRCDNAEGRNSRDHRTTFRASVSNLTQSVCSICCEVSVCLSSIWSIWTTWSICLSVYLSVHLSCLSIWSFHLIYRCIWSVCLLLLRLSVWAVWTIWSIWSTESITIQSICLSSDLSDFSDLSSSLSDLSDLSHLSVGLSVYAGCVTIYVSELSDLSDLLDLSVSLSVNPPIYLPACLSFSRNSVRRHPKTEAAKLKRRSSYPRLPPKTKSCRTENEANLRDFLHLRNVGSAPCSSLPLRSAIFYCQVLKVLLLPGRVIRRAT